MNKRNENKWKLNMRKEKMKTIIILVFGVHQIPKINTALLLILCCSAGNQRYLTWPSLTWPCLTWPVSDRDRVGNGYSCSVYSERNICIVYNKIVTSFELKKGGGDVSCPCTPASACVCAHVWVRLGKRMRVSVDGFARRVLLEVCVCVQVCLYNYVFWRISPCMLLCVRVLCKCMWMYNCDVALCVCEAWLHC